jgi:hypothetical protein
MAAENRRFRLVDRHGEPHPILDDHFDSLEEAWDLAREWSQQQGGTINDGALEDIGIEVSTGSGAWRRLGTPAAAPSPEA